MKMAEYFASFNRELFQMQSVLHEEEWEKNLYHTLSTALDEFSHKPMSL